MGVGGFSRVWRVRNRSTKALVALKVSVARHDPRFEREAQAMRRLGSKVGPALVEVGETRTQQRFLAMELLEGESMAHWLASCQAPVPPLSIVMGYLEDLCESVAQVHEAKVLHRDLKPENIMLLRSGGLRLLDFGLARDLTGALADEDEESLSLTRTGALVGTVAYIAPEQSLGRKCLGPSADIYSLGVIAFELLTGRPPFVGTRSSILQAHTWQKAPKISHLAKLSPSVDEVVGKALAKNPDARFRTARHFFAALQKSLKAGSSSDGRQAETKSSRREMALLAVYGPVPVADAQKAASSVKGQIARTSAEHLVLVFPALADLKQGVAAAVAVAHELSPIATTCVVHVAGLRARAGARGVIVMGDAIKTDTWSAGFVAGLFATAQAAPHVIASQLALSPEGLHEIVRHVPQLTATNTGTVDWQSLALRIQPWGREDFIAGIKTEARACFDNRQALLTTVIGETGLGKSHFASYLLELVRTWHKVRVISLSAGADGEDRGDSLLQSLVREAFQLGIDDLSCNGIRRRCEAILGIEAAAEAWPVVARTLDLIDSGEFARESFLVGPTAARQALARAIALALTHCSHTQALAIVLDDAHRADFTTLDALELATLTDDEAPLWVLAVAGPELEVLRPNWGARAKRSARHKLMPLQDEAARGMLLQLLFPVEFIPEAVVRNLIELTQGVPLYLEEIASALKQSGVVRQRGETGSWIVASDELIAASKTPLGERLARATLSGMREDLALFAQLCAVVAHEIRADFVDGVQQKLDSELGFSSLDPSAGLAHLVQCGILRKTAKRVYDFRHPMMREAVEGLIPLALRRVLHSAVLAFLDLENASPTRIARHAEMCGQNRLAASQYMQLAAAAEARFRYVEAQQSYSSALANLSQEDSQDREKALTGRGRVHYCVGRHDDALADLEAAMIVATKRDDKLALAEMLLEQSTILDWKFQYAESALAGRKASKLSQGIDDPRLRLRCDLATARSTFREERLGEAIELLSKVEAIAEEQNDYTTRVIALAVLGGALVGVERLDDAENCLNTMASLSEKVGDRFHLAVAHANRMHVWGARHDYDRAIEDARLAIQVAKEIGAFPIIWVAQHTLAQLLMWLGKYDEAAPLAEEARAIQHRFSDTPDPHDTLLIARIKVVSCAPRETLREELAFLRAQYKPVDLSPSHQIQIAMIELWEGEGPKEQWNALMRRSDALEIDERLEFLLVYARAAKRAGRGDDVTRVVTLAHELADSRSLWLSHFDLLQSDLLV